MSWIDEAETRCAAATPGPWFYHNGYDQHGDACDLIVAEIDGTAPADEDPEFVEVFYENELGLSQIQANWDFALCARADLPRALKALRAVEKIAQAHQRETVTTGDVSRCPACGCVARGECSISHARYCSSELARAALAAIRGTDE